MKDKINCAICGDVAELKSSFDDFFVGKINKKIHVNFYSYQCDACEESFTTNKIDQLNLNNVRVLSILIFCAMHQPEHYHF